jgi:hypothetical protein
LKKVRTLIPLSSKEEERSEGQEEDSGQDNGALHFRILKYSN